MPAASIGGYGRVAHAGLAGAHRNAHGNGHPTNMDAVRPTTYSTTDGAAPYPGAGGDNHPPAHTYQHPYIAHADANGNANEHADAGGDI